MKLDLDLDARRGLCCVVCVFSLWHGVEPECSAAGLDSHRPSLIADKAQTQRRSVESRAAPSFSPLLHRDLFLLTLVSYCAKLPTNIRIISCHREGLLRGKQVREEIEEGSCLWTWGLDFSVPQHQLACCPLLLSSWEQEIKRTLTPCDCQAHGEVTMRHWRTTECRVYSLAPLLSGVISYLLSSFPCFGVWTLEVVFFQNVVWKS